MESCEFIIDCNRFRKYYDIAKRRDRGLFSTDVGLRTKAFMHLTRYCTGPHTSECPEKTKVLPD